VRTPQLLRFALAFALVTIGSGTAAAITGAEGKQDTRLPCAVYDTNIGEYGAFVFRLKTKPRACVEYQGNQPCHCTEANLVRIHWRHWGAPVARATATFRFCATGTCVRRRAHLIAFRKRFPCHLPVYTRLRLFVAARGRGPDSPHPSRSHFKLPACPTVFDET
jgi:hypothetical protein